MLACNAFGELDAQAASMSADLSSWDFLQDLDLDFGVDQATDNKAQPQALTSQLTSTERVREQNRKTQQRTRQRKKVVQQRYAGSLLSAAVLEPLCLFRNDQRT